MGTIQDFFDQQRAGDITLPPGEYEGPLVIRRACVLDGSGATLWADSGPVLRIEAPGVLVKRLRVEVTGGPGVAIETTEPSAVLSEVAVSGGVSGFPQESEGWALPGSVSFGSFSAEAENTFLVSLEAPAEAEISSNIQDLRLSLRKLSPGRNHLLLTTAKLRHNTILYGELFVRTAVTRRIFVTGKALRGAPVFTEAAPEPAAGSRPLRVRLPAEVVAPVVPEETVPAVTRGQRVPVKDLPSPVLKIVYGFQGTSCPLEIDGYCFLLGERGKVRRDEDLVFFGNPEPAGMGIKVSAADGCPVVQMDLPKVPPQVWKIAVCHSIYGDDPRQNFSQVSGAVIRIFSGGKEALRFALDGLDIQKAVVSMEVYRYKGEWRMNFVGAGWQSGLRQLCESYGVEVE